MQTILFNSTDLLRSQIQRRFTNSQISEQLLDQLEMVMVAPEFFEASDFQHFELQELLQYLRASHDFYREVWVPKIDQTLWQLKSRSSNGNWSINSLQLVFNAYKKELDEHMQQEEKVLFSFVDNMLDGKDCEGHRDLVINHFIHTHDDQVVLHIEQLKEEALFMDTSLRSNFLFELLFTQLSAFQNDLQVHALIEDEVIVSKIVAHYQ